MKRAASTGEARQARVELLGALVATPELRVTPSGQPWLRLWLECGEQGQQLRFEIVVAGIKARELATQLKAGMDCRVVGSLRPITRQDTAGIKQRGFEVLASEVLIRNGTQL